MKFSIIGQVFLVFQLQLKLKKKYPRSEVIVFEKERDILMGQVEKTNLDAIKVIIIQDQKKPLRSAKQVLTNLINIFRVAI